MRRLLPALAALAAVASAQPAAPSPALAARFAAATAVHGDQYVRTLAYRSGNMRTACERGWTGCEAVPLAFEVVDGLVSNHLAASAEAPDARGALLFYAADGDALDAWLLTGGGRLAHAPVAGGLVAVAADLGALRAAFGVDAGQAGRAPRFAWTDEEAPPGPGPADAAARLADRLLPPPIRAGLGGLDRLVVVPAGEVGLVPFAALPVDGALLLDRLAVSVAPSLPDFVAALRRPDAQVRRGWDWTADALVVGGPAFRPDGTDPRLPPLAGAEAEARVVATLVGADPLTGAAATLAAVRERAPTAGYLHFATHGAADPDDPLERGGLYFADDALWAFSSIRETPLDTAFVVVLSACQTGLGRADPAGVVGIARAFALQGAEHVVMSLWNVDDQATVALMTAFVAALRRTCEGAVCDVPGALREATRTTRSTWPDAPARWAPFVHFGVPPR